MSAQHQQQRHVIENGGTSTKNEQTADLTSASGGSKTGHHHQFYKNHVRTSAACLGFGRSTNYNKVRSSGSATALGLLNGEVKTGSTYCHGKPRPSNRIRQEIEIEGLTQPERESISAAKSPNNLAAVLEVAQGEGETIKWNIQCENETLSNPSNPLLRNNEVEPQNCSSARDEEKTSIAKVTDQ